MRAFICLIYLMTFVPDAICASENRKEVARFEKTAIFLSDIDQPLFFESSDDENVTLYRRKHNLATLLLGRLTEKFVSDNSIAASADEISEFLSAMDTGVRQKLSKLIRTKNSLIAERAELNKLSDAAGRRDDPSPDDKSVRTLTDLHRMLETIERKQWYIESLISQYEHQYEQMRQLDEKNREMRADSLIRIWKFHKRLYEMYPDSDVVWNDAGGPMPYGSLKKLFADAERRGIVQIVDPDYKNCLTVLLERRPMQIEVFDTAAPFQIPWWEMIETVDASHPEVTDALVDRVYPADTQVQRKYERFKSFWSEAAVYVVMALSFFLPVNMPGLFVMLILWMAYRKTGRNSRVRQILTHRRALALEITAMGAVLLLGMDDPEMIWFARLTYPIIGMGIILWMEEFFLELEPTRFHLVVSAAVAIFFTPSVVILGGTPWLDWLPMVAVFSVKYLREQQELIRDPISALFYQGGVLFAFYLIFWKIYYVFRISVHPKNPSD